MTNKECIHFNGDFEALRRKRTGVLLQIWDHLIDEKIIDPSRFKLAYPLLNEVIEHYLSDVKVLKCRYGIDDKIQLHKIAGLMTALILRYRPIIPIIDEYHDKREIYINEFYAIIHGLAICGEYSLKECEKISEQPWFNGWVSDFTYLLHHRNHTPESLIFIFETFSIFNFPNNFASIDY
jgi:hypothetical protein